MLCRAISDSIFACQDEIISFENENYCGEFFFRAIILSLLAPCNFWDLITQRMSPTCSAMFAIRNYWNVHNTPDSRLEVSIESTEL
jgi:hypothetical protein